MSIKDLGKREEVSEKLRSFGVASDDIVLTALAGISCITKFNIEKVIEYSKEKAANLLEFQKKYGVIAKSIAREIEFILPRVDKLEKTYNLKF